MADAVATKAPSKSGEASPYNAIDPKHVIEPHRVRYSADGLITAHQCEFVNDARFQRAYARAQKAGHRLGTDFHMEWRVHVTCWAAQHGAALEGDFVECGCYTGITSSAITEYLDFGRMDRKLYLFDTFEGIALDLLTDAEKKKEAGYASKNERLYQDFFEVTRRNFEHLPNVILVRGKVPFTLKEMPIDKVAYLHIDMNSVVPEVEAVRYFWPKLSPGAAVVLDDYGFKGHDVQRRGMDDLGREIGFQVLSLPTGQGMMIKGSGAPGGR